MPAIAVLFLCAPLGLALGRFAVLLAPLALVAALLAIPVDEARADSGHPGGSYPLHCVAGQAGDLSAVVHLLGSAHEINVNARDGGYSYSCGGGFAHSGESRRTPLHWAARYGRATIAATLIAAGANVNAKNNSSYTPLHETWHAQGNRFRPLGTFYGIEQGGGAAVASVLIAAGGHWGEACAGAAVVNPAGPSPPCLCEPPNVGTVDNCQPPNPSVEVCGGLTPPLFYSATLSACAPYSACQPAGDCEFTLASCTAATLFYNGTDCESFKPCAGGTLDRQTNTCECAAPAVSGNNCECRSPNLEFAVGDCRAPSVENCAEYDTPPLFFDPTRGECAGRLYPCHDSAVVKADNSGCECPGGDYAHGDPSGGEWVDRVRVCERFNFGFGCRWKEVKWRKSIPDTAECHADHAPVAHDLDDWTVAIETKKPTLVAHFIADHGQDPDADDALHLAARHSALGIAKLLLQRGANPDAADSDGDTPLHEVARLDDAADNVALVSLLLDKGANPNIGNNARWRPLDLAYGRTDSFPPRRKMMAALITGGADWASECTGGTVPNGNYQGAAEAATYPRCGCPAHISQRDSFGACECPGHSHAQVNGRCLPKDSALVADEIEKMRAELERLRALLAELNVRLSLAADGPPEMLEEIAKQAEQAARGIARRRNNFLALARAGLAEADDAGAAPTLALSDTEATCRMLEGEVQTHSRTGSKICSGIDHNDTFCIVGSASAFPCVGFFRHVRRCNDRFNRPALDPWHCAKKCADGLRARGAKCKPES